MKAPLTYQEYDKKGLRLFPSQIKDLYEQIQQLKEAHNTLRNHTQSLEDEVKQLKEQRHRKNMLIENWKKQLVSKAMLINKMSVCPHCGGLTYPKTV